MTERTITHSENGLTYEIRLFEQDGKIMAEITVLEGHMDVNAVYYGDDDFSGTSASLGGALNMNGAGSQLDGERVQWDDAVFVSNAGLGRLGTDKPSYLAEGDTLTVELDASSLDEIAIIGLRATSTSTDGGSIKIVSPVEEPPEEEPEDPTFDKLFFVLGTGANDNGPFEFGVSIFASDNGSTSPNDAFLPDGSAGTLQDYLDAFAALAADRPGWPDPDEVQTIKVYQVNDNGDLVLVGELDPAVLNGAPLPTLPVENEDDVLPEPPEDEEEDQLATV